MKKHIILPKDASEFESLKERVLSILQDQGFHLSKRLDILDNNKEMYRFIQNNAKNVQFYEQRDFIINNMQSIKNIYMTKKRIVPENIRLELREVKPNTNDELFYKWWNIVWWSIPYQKAFGRQIRFILWDIEHNYPFGIIGLQSPILKMQERDDFLGIKDNEIDYWINRSMNAQRLGALLPYNHLLGGKMAALTLVSNELRESYRQKYKDYVSKIKKRKIESELLFITTTSAFGRSSIYNRIKIGDKLVAQPLGYTKGSGSFHIPDSLYFDMLKYLDKKGVNINRGMGYGTSRKRQLLRICFDHFGLKHYEYHGIKREIYLFSLVENIREVIDRKEKPKWSTSPLENLVKYWKDRWAIPRSIRKNDWENFSVNDYIDNACRLLKKKLRGCLK